MYENLFLSFESVLTLFKNLLTAFFTGTATATLVANPKIPVATE